MKLLVCGGREYGDKARLYSVLDAVHESEKITHLIHGDARGADRLAHGWAVQNGVQPVRVPALWEIFGPRAGAVRNTRMLALNPARVIAFPGGIGTAHMVRIAKAAGISVTMID